jgi:hypothetical protein
MQNHTEPCDVTAPEKAIQIEIQERKQFGKNTRVLYVHIDGVTVLRVCRIPDDFVIEGLTQ